MSQEEVQFVAFHAINEFMIPEYRNQVLEEVYKGSNDLSPELQKSIQRATKQNVKVPGFRNSSNAPVSLKIRNSVTAFEKNPRFVALILSAWSELNAELKTRVHELLSERNWDMLPALDGDRSKLPGFFVTWPKAETYDVLEEVFNAKYPEAQYDENDVRLMVVWVSNRLPYQMSQDDEALTEEAEN